MALGCGVLRTEQVDVDTTLTVVLESLAHLARLRRPVLTLPLEPRRRQKLVVVAMMLLALAGFSLRGTASPLASALDRSDTGGPLLQCFGFFVPFGGSIHLRQVLKAPRHSGMVRAEGLLPYRERAFVERLRLCVLALGFVERGQVVANNLLLRRPGSLMVVRSPGQVTPAPRSKDGT